MSQEQWLFELSNKLEKWKSHNEVHAKPADQMLYEFLKQLINFGGNEEPSIELANVPDQEEAEALPTESDASAISETDPPGDNNPDAPDIP